MRTVSSSGSANSANQTAVNSIAARTFCPSATGSPSRPRVSPLPEMKPEVHDEQQHHAAEIAHGPTQSGDPPGRLRGGQVAQHCVVRHACQLGAAGGQGEQRQARHEVVVVVADQAHRRGQHHRQYGQQRERASPPPRCVDPDAGHRRQCGHRHACQQHGDPEPQGGTGVAGQVIGRRCPSGTPRTSRSGEAEGEALPTRRGRWLASPICSTRSPRSCPRSSSRRSTARRTSGSSGSSRGATPRPRASGTTRRLPSGCCSSRGRPG